MSTPLRVATARTRLGLAYTRTASPNLPPPPLSHANQMALPNSYFENAIEQLIRFKSNDGDEGVAELNAICHAHVITIGPDEAKRNTYCGVDVDAGRLRILFA